MACRYSGVKEFLEILGGRKGSYRDWDGGVAVIDNFREIAFSFLISFLVGGYFKELCLSIFTPVVNIL